MKGRGQRCVWVQALNIDLPGVKRVSRGFQDGEDWIEGRRSTSLGADAASLSDSAEMLMEEQ